MGDNWGCARTCKVYGLVLNLYTGTVLEQDLYSEFLNIQSFSGQSGIAFIHLNQTGLKVAPALLPVCLYTMATVNIVLKYYKDWLREIGWRAKIKANYLLFSLKYGLRSKIIQVDIRKKKKTV